MHIEHIALWVKDLEMMRGFYQEVLGFNPGEKYVNPNNGFQSYFLSNQVESATRLELMHRANMEESDIGLNQVLGLSHIAFAVGSREKVEELTLAMLNLGCHQLRPARMTGDGYYESLMLDPEGNRIELTV